MDSVGALPAIRCKLLPANKKNYTSELQSGGVIRLEGW